MSPHTHLLRRLISLGRALFLWALASHAMTADSLTLRISPRGVELHMEGSQK